MVDPGVQALLMKDVTTWNMAHIQHPKIPTLLKRNWLHPSLPTSHHTSLLMIFLIVLSLRAAYFVSTHQVMRSESVMFVPSDSCVFQDV
ncbi:hypothetical protein DKK75_07500 [Bifidobacterium asteroides]|uniref:Uncharacterized protein n=1 Tax=Bifidobacterium asteroides TaxID=1684 RepID=A0A318M2E3_9BIFI|nr:hypothetical protein DKK75_07500 [Bifidobacterium asteroides]